MLSANNYKQATNPNDSKISSIDGYRTLHALQQPTRLNHIVSQTKFILLHSSHQFNSSLCSIFSRLFFHWAKLLAYTIYANLHIHTYWRIKKRTSSRKKRKSKKGTEKGTNETSTKKYDKWSLEYTKMRTKTGNILILGVLFGWFFFCSWILIFFILLLDFLLYMRFACMRECFVLFSLISHLISAFGVFFSFFFGSFHSNFFHFFLLSIHNDKNKYTNWNPHTYRETKTQTNTLELCSFPFFIHFRFCDFGWLCLIRAFFLFNQIF